MTAKKSKKDLKAKTNDSANDQLHVKEIIRKSIHFFLGVSIIAVLIGFGRDMALGYGIGLLVLGLITIFVLRERKISFLENILKLVSRKNESKGHGAFMLVIGCIIAVAFFAYPISLGALIVLVFGDAFSTIMGKQYGRIKLVNGRTLEGTAYGLFLSAIVLSFWFSPFISFMVAWIGMMAEFLPIEDNLSIPLLAGITLLALL